MKRAINNTTPTVDVGDVLPVQMDCSSPLMVVSNGSWFGQQPLSYSLPLFCAQLLMVTIASRVIYQIIRPLRLPRVVSEVLAGIFLGPSFLGRLLPFWQVLCFPQRSLYLLSSVANIGILYYSFMIGLEIDASALKKLTKNIITVGVLSIAIPFSLSLPLAYSFRLHFEQEGSPAFYIYVSIALSMTSFPVLARVLSERKMLSLEIGRCTLLGSVLGELVSWVLLAASVSMSGVHEDIRVLNGVTIPAKPMVSYMVLLYSLGFLAACAFLVRPAYEWLSSRTPEGEPISDIQVGTVIMGVMLAGFLTDFIGVHHVFGAFVYGLMIPRGQHATSIVERLNDVLMEFIVPFYFVISGLKMNFPNSMDHRLALVLVAMSVIAAAAKVIAGVSVSLLFRLPLSEGVSIGFLMNCQGLFEVVLLNIARDNYAVSDESFVVLVITSTVITALVQPLLTLVNATTKKLVMYDTRTIMEAKPGSKLQLLACIHSPSNIQSILRLLDISNPTKEAPVYVTALHLLELRGRGSAMVISHESELSFDLNGESETVPQSRPVISAFENYEKNTVGIYAQSVTSVASYTNMPDDIRSIAAEKHVAIIILPFDKGQSMIDHAEDAASLAIRNVNMNVLDQSPCSVGLLIDRGLSKKKNKADGYYRILALFIGGPDDREAVSYAWRMSESALVHLTLIRFVVGEKAVRHSNASSSFSDSTNTIMRDSVNMEMERDRAIDEGFVREFRMKNLGNESIEFLECVANNSEEMVKQLKSMDTMYDLYVVGRSQGASPLTYGMTDWMEKAELGVIGDWLASTEMGEMKSVLVVQQYNPLKVNEMKEKALSMSFQG